MIVDEDAQEFVRPVAVQMGVEDAIAKILVEYLFFAAVDAFTVRNRAAPQLRSGPIEEGGRTHRWFLPKGSSSAIAGPDPDRGRHRAPTETSVRLPRVSGAFAAMLAPR